MTESHQFAVDIFRIICERLHVKAADIQIMAETTSSFEEWLNWEAFLACKHYQATYPFCEVTAKPTYASENVADDDGDRDRGFGDL